MTSLDVKRQILEGLLASAKVQSIKEIYERITPGPDGRIRTSLAPYTDTGRLRSRETFLEVSTNLQNLPKKTAKLDPAFNVRRCLVADPGFVLLEGDLSQAEVYATAAYAGDSAKIERMLGGEDEHKRLARVIYGVEEVSWAQRHVGKMSNHGGNYGIGWKTFMSQVNADADLTGVTISAQEAKAAVNAFRRANPKTVMWWARVKEQVNRLGYLTNCFGRKRIFLDRAESSLNRVLAFLPQSTVADHVNDRLVEAHRTLDPHPLQVLLQVHDAILCQVPRGLWFGAARSLKRLMETPLEVNGITFTIPVEVSIGENWGEMKEVKT